MRSSHQRNSHLNSIFDNLFRDCFTSGNTFRLFSNFFMRRQSRQHQYQRNGYSHNTNSHSCWRWFIFLSSLLLLLRIHLSGPLNAHTSSADLTRTYAVCEIWPLIKGRVTRSEHHKSQWARTHSCLKFMGEKTAAHFNVFCFRKLAKAIFWSLLGFRRQIESHTSLACLIRIETKIFLKELRNGFDIFLKRVFHATNWNVLTRSRGATSHTTDH